MTCNHELLAYPTVNLLRSLTLDGSLVLKTTGDKASLSVGVVELSQTPEYDPQKRLSCVLKADELIKVDTWA